MQWVEWSTQGRASFDAVGNWGGCSLVTDWPFVSEQQNISSPVVSSIPQKFGGPVVELKSKTRSLFILYATYAQLVIMIVSRYVLLAPHWLPTVHSVPLPHGGVSWLVWHSKPSSNSS